MRATARFAVLTLSAGIFGLIFGLGLVLSHMVDPARIAAFLDVTGDWNPALAFVMGGAIVVAAPALGDPALSEPGSAAWFLGAGPNSRAASSAGTHRPNRLWTL